MASRGLTMYKRCKRIGWAVLAALALAAVAGYRSDAYAGQPVISYNASTGMLSLSDSGANYDAALEAFQVFVPDVLGRNAYERQFLGHFELDRQFNGSAQSAGFLVGGQFGRFSFAAKRLLSCPISAGTGQ